MKVEFEYFDKPMPINEDTLNLLKEKGDKMFVIVREKKTAYSYEKYEDETIYKETVEIMQFYPTIILLGHDFLHFRKLENYTMVGYCPIEFPKQYEIKI